MTTPPPAASSVPTPPPATPPAPSTPVEQQIKAAEQEWLDGWRVGPTRLRWEAVPPQVGDPAPNLELLDMTGKSVQLKDLWQEKPLMIIFWRHFGCSCGMDRASKLKKEYQDYLKAGGSVVVIGQGEPERTALYAEQNGIPCKMLCDPNHLAYKAYGLLEGAPSQILFDAPEAILGRDWMAGVKMAEERRAKGRPMVDSPWQLPGEFVVDKYGIIRLAYRYNFCEDWPDARVFAAALQDASSARWKISLEEKK